MKKKILIVVNVLLFIIILIFSFHKLYKINIVFNCEYGAHPEKLLAIATENFPGLGDSDLKVICIFNTLPGMDILENIEKLWRLYGARVFFGVIFNKNFKPAYVLEFPYKTLPRYRFSCNKKGATIEAIFLFLQGDKIVHNTETFDFFSLNFIIQKKIDPSLSMTNTQISTADLKASISKRLTGNELELYDLNTGALSKFNDMARFSKIYFFHANCSGCRLKSLIQDIKLLEIMDKENAVIIFSIYANRFELKLLLEQNQTVLPVFIDIKDEFLLSSRITNDKETPIIISREELRRLL